MCVCVCMFVVRVMYSICTLGGLIYVSDSCWEVDIAQSVQPSPQSTREEGQSVST
jgi:hypothetical protein